MPQVGFESTISAGERPQTYALDRAATGTGISGPPIYNNLKFSLNSFSQTLLDKIKFLNLYINIYLIIIIVIIMVMKD